MSSCVEEPLCFCLFAIFPSFTGGSGKKLLAEFYLQAFAIQQYFQRSHCKWNWWQFSYWLCQWICEREAIISIWEARSLQEKFAGGGGKTASLIMHELLNNSICVRHGNGILWVTLGFTALFNRSNTQPYTFYIAYRSFFSGTFQVLRHKSGITDATSIKNVEVGILIK